MFSPQIYLLILHSFYSFLFLITNLLCKIVNEFHNYETRHVDFSKGHVHSNNRIKIWLVRRWDGKK